MSPKRIVPPLLLAVAAGAVLWYFVRAPRAATDGLVASGTVEATEARLGFQIPGRLVEVAPREGDRVLAGAPIARLDTTETDARRAQAIAAAQSAQAALAELEAGSRREEIAQSRAAHAAAVERLAAAERDRERAQLLFDGRAISREAHERALSAHELARAALDQAAEQLRQVEQGPRPERIAAARAQLAQAEAAVATAEAQLAHHHLLAPFAGVVTVRHREPGEIVAAGTAVVTLLDPEDRWVRIYVPENRLGAVRLGQAAEIRADTFPGRGYAGEVAFLASEAEFTPKNVQTAEERVRLVYAVKVRITGDPEGQLKPGLPADVTLELTPK